MKKRAKRNPASSVELFAQPYDTSASGFAFTSAEEYEKEYEKRLPVEEYELDFLEGSEIAQVLFKQMGRSRIDLEDYFDAVDRAEALDSAQQAAIAFLVEHMNSNKSPGDLVDEAEDVNVHEGDVESYAYEFIDGMGGPGELPKDALEMYFDYASYARDLELNGDVTEFEFDGTTYTTDYNR